MSERDAIDLLWLYFGRAAVSIANYRSIIHADASGTHSTLHIALHAWRPLNWGASNVPICISLLIVTGENSVNYLSLRWLGHIVLTALLVCIARLCVANRSKIFGAYVSEGVLLEAG